MISFGNKDKAVVLKALWDNSKAQGMSFFWHYQNQIKLQWSNVQLD